MNPAGPIFISYRRSDTGGHAGRLFDRLRHWFDARDLFYDLNSIDPGNLFRQQIEATVGAAKVVLVLIGPDWLDEINRRALQSKDDLVRVEIELALRLNAAHGTPKIIPVLLGGASPPSLQAMHAAARADLQRLPELDMHEFHGKNADWDHQFVRLRGLIAEVPGVPAPRYRAAAGEVKAFRVTDHLLSPHFRDPALAIARLRRALVANGNAAIVAPAALYGMGGVGKTQLALKYSRDYRDSYAGLWWFRAESDHVLQLDARDACLKTGAPLADGELPTAAFKRWLEQQEQPWLLAFDNAESVDALRPYLPQGGPHHVLITSRNPAWGGVARTIELAAWTEEEGAEFLDARLRATERNELRRLSRALGGLPLALEQAAAFLEQTRGSIAEYCALVEDVDTGALVLDEGRASTGYERSVLATLSLAFPHLGEAAQHLLRVCAFFSADPIPERYFRDNPDPLSQALAGAAKQSLAWERTVSELRRFSIAERVDVPSLDRLPGQPDERVEKALTLHRLTLEVARHLLSVRDEDGPRAQQLMRAYCPQESEDPKQWPRFTALLPHLGSLDRLRSHGCLDRRVHAWMLDRAASYLRCGKALYQESERMFRAALELRRTDCGEEHPDVLLVMNDLAGTLLAQGDFNGARTLQEQVLSVRLRVLGEEHPHTWTSMSNLAETMRAQCDLSAARVLQERVLSVRHRVLGEEDLCTVRSMNNFAGTLQAQGELGAARVLQERVLSICLRILGEGHPLTLAAMLNLAITLRQQDDVSGARALQEKELSICRRVLGEVHPTTRASMRDLATTLRQQGDLHAARMLLESALSTCRCALGEEHPETLASMNELAATLFEQGDLSSARVLHEKALPISRRVLGKEHPDALASMNNFATVLALLGVLDEAENLMEQAVNGRLSQLGAEDPRTQWSIRGLAEIRAVRKSTRRRLP